MHQVGYDRLEKIDFHLVIAFCMLRSFGDGTICEMNHPQASKAGVAVAKVEKVMDLLKEIRRLEAPNAEA